MASPSPRVILYAEDDDNDAFLVQHAFEKAGIAHPVVVVSSGSEAIQYLSGDGIYADRSRYPLPWLVLLDLNMPGVSGLDVLKWIRVTPSLSTLITIVLSSSNQDMDIHRSYLQGANGYLVKPAKIEEMITMARSIRDYWITQNRSGPWVHINGSNGEPTSK
jgi:CheY-like chemotaxis protein